MKHFTTCTNPVAEPLLLVFFCLRWVSHRNSLRKCKREGKLCTFEAIMVHGANYKSEVVIISPCTGTKQRNGDQRKRRKKPKPQFGSRRTDPFL